MSWGHQREGQRGPENILRQHRDVTVPFPEQRGILKGLPHLAQVVCIHREQSKATSLQLRPMLRRLCSLLHVTQWHHHHRCVQWTRVPGCHLHCAPAPRKQDKGEASRRESERKYALENWLEGKLTHILKAIKLGSVD